MAGLPADLERELETHTIAVNQWLYAQGVGLEVAEGGYAAPAAEVVRLAARVLALPTVDLAARYYAVEAVAESERLPHDEAVASALDAHARAEALACSEGVLTWRNWKAFEREAPEAATLAAGFEALVAGSARAQPALEARLAQVRQSYAAHGLTPVHTFCFREGLTPEDLTGFLRAVGAACRGPFRAALDALSQAVFGRSAGPAELRALYLNRMYEPQAARVGGGPTEAVRAALGHFRAAGFPLDHIPVDLAPRPNKYPGAFCFPVATPADVRVSVRIASPHHLVDMLYHELGHAAHFSGIRADLPFVDRYWIHSGVHETFSTLFEAWLAEPAFLRTELGLDAAGAAQLAAFARFKTLLNGTWQVASALTAVEGWLEALSWPEIEARYAQHAEAWLGVSMPPGFARLHAFVNELSIYPAGYVLAEARVHRWLAELRALGGEAWWRSPAAQTAIRAQIALGARATLPPLAELMPIEWLD